MSSSRILGVVGGYGNRSTAKVQIAEVCIAEVGVRKRNEIKLRIGEFCLAEVGV